jgi:hypothetical protein
METLEQLKQEREAAIAAVREHERHRPSKHPPILTGSCSEDVRRANEWLTSSDERAAAMVEWESEHETARRQALKLSRRVARAWTSLVEEAWAEHEQRASKTPIV